MEVSPKLLYAMMVLIAAALVFLAMLTTVWSSRRSYRERREALLVVQLRPRLLDALERDVLPPIGDNRRERAVILGLVTGLVSSLRGTERERLGEFLEERGIIEAALLSLHSRATVRRLRGIELLGQAGVARAVPELVRLLQDRDADVRRSAVRALGRIGDGAATYPLLQTIDAQTVPLNATTMALLRMGRDINIALAQGLAYGSVLLRATCAELLGLRLAISAVAELTTAAGSDPALEVRIRAIRALGGIGTPASVDALVNAMAAGQPTRVRAVATRALGRIGGPRTVSLLRYALYAPEHVVASNAARALATCGDAGESALATVASDPTTLAGQYAEEGLSMIALARAGRG